MIYGNLCNRSNIVERFLKRVYNFGRFRNMHGTIFHFYKRWKSYVFPMIFRYIYTIYRRYYQLSLAQFLYFLGGGRIVTSNGGAVYKRKYKERICCCLCHKGLFFIKRGYSRYSHIITQQSLKLHKVHDRVCTEKSPFVCFLYERLFLFISSLRPYLRTN